MNKTKIQTKNTIYTVTDLSDDGLRCKISGHSRFCPTSTDVALFQRPEVGRRILFTPLEGPYKGNEITTTEVVSID